MMPGLFLWRRLWIHSGLRVGAGSGRLSIADRRSVTSGSLWTSAVQICLEG